MSYIVVISAHLFWVGKQGRARLGEVLLRSVILSLSVRHNTGPPNNQTNKRARKKLKKTFLRHFQQSDNVQQGSTVYMQGMNGTLNEIGLHRTASS